MGGLGVFFCCCFLGSSSREKVMVVEREEDLGEKKESMGQVFRLRVGIF